MLCRCHLDPEDSPGEAETGERGNSGGHEIPAEALSPTVREEIDGPNLAFVPRIAIAGWSDVGEAEDDGVDLDNKNRLPLSGGLGEVPPPSFPSLDGVEPVEEPLWELSLVRRLPGANMNQADALGVASDRWSDGHGPMVLAKLDRCNRS